MTAAQHETPWPFDAVIAGTPVMLVHDGRDPGWYEEKVNYFENSAVLTEEDRKYSEFPPELEAPYAVTDLSGGMGQFEQDPARRDRYHYGLFVDASTGKPVKGPAFNAHTALAGGDVNQFIVYDSALYAAVGDRLYKRTGDGAGDWSLINDFNLTIGQMAVFQGTQSAPYLFVPVGSTDEYYTLDTSDVLVQHASQEAEGFEVVGTVLTLFTTESGIRVIREAEDGGTAATWGAATAIGDPTEPVNWLRAVADRLMVLKDDSVFGPSFDLIEIDADLTPSLRPLEKSGNGKQAINWNERLVFPHGDNLYDYEPNSGELRQIGPELLEANTSEVKGPVRALAEQPGLCLWAGVHNSGNSASYLLKYGTWRVVGGQGNAAREFVPAWHGALYKWASKQVTTMHVTTLVGGLPRLYVGFSDSSIQWCKLARTANALDDPNYAFDTSNDGYLYYPRYTGGFPFEQKMLRALGVGGRGLGSGKSISAEYKSAADSTYAVAGSVNAEPGQRVSIAAPTAARAWDLSAKLVATASSSPVLTAFVAFAAIRTTNLKTITALVKAEDGVADRNGRATVLRWQDLRDRLEEAMVTNSAIEVITPAGETVSVIGVSYAHRFFGWDPKKQGPRWAITLRMVQTDETATAGTWDILGRYTWDELADFTWDQLATLR